MSFFETACEIVAPFAPPAQVVRGIFMNAPAAYIPEGLSLAEAHAYNNGWNHFWENGQSYRRSMEANPFRQYADQQREADAWDEGMGAADQLDAEHCDDGC